MPDDQEKDVKPVLVPIPNLAPPTVSFNEDLVSESEPRLYPAIFRSLHTVASLNKLQSKGWHQFLRTNLIFFASRPAISLMARKARLSKTPQKISSLFAVFILSGILHELYILLMVTTKTSFIQYLSLNPFPGMLFYFMIQPFGILLQPFIIPLIPESLNGEHSGCGLSPCS
ncbi:hypothetical protein PCANC_21408 [Puccinia coronata f. sp. avenae]|uniref:Wax synthase domain-containing protein n=1 Tax=Puccinia coronata f. sp. avenae TaxID=200324 RepID=A0A2N5UTE3_9BASI|nr:hypothetical protein PCANC_21408 [Puccinia coronata f. sp. avenae]